MIVLDASIVNIALPSAQADLGISNADRQWVVTAYTLSFGALLLLGGRIADYTGRKRTFILGLLGFAAASAIGGLAPNQEMLFAARAPAGRVRGADGPAALSLITVTFTEPKERAKAFGVFGALAGGGAAIGLIVGGVLTEYASWRWCLGVNVPVALIVAAAAVLLVHESKAHGDTRYDIPGVLLATVGLFSLVYGFTEAARAKHPERPAVAPPSRGGPARPRSPSWSSRSCCWSRSSSGSAAARTRCCRCGSSSTATAAAPTWSSCSWAPGCSRCSCS